MRDLIISILGEYSPLQNDNGEVITTISGIDFVWLVGAILFLIFVYGFVRIIGGLIVKK